MQALDQEKSNEIIKLKNDLAALNAEREDYKVQVSDLNDVVTA
jgi:hypothetical protein